MQQIFELYAATYGEPPKSFEIMQSGGSSRSYFLLNNANENVLVATYNENVGENNAFLYLSGLFCENGICAPRIFAVSEDRKTYLQEYLGKSSLYDFYTEHGWEKSRPFFEKSIDQLVKIQYQLAGQIDFRKTLPPDSFSREVIFYDLNYFRFFFLKLLDIPVNEAQIEADFERLAQQIAKLAKYSLHLRDFQSRNIIVVGDNCYFIDFQALRQGLPHYDLASLIYQARLNLDKQQQDYLYDYYLKKTEKYVRVDMAEFRNNFLFAALIRQLQTLGTYGFRGIVEGKMQFRTPMRQAIENVRLILSQLNNSLKLHELKQVFDYLPDNQKLNKFMNTQKMTIKILSFSYKKGLPQDNSEHGGGFIFDCRAIHNPGRYDAYKQLNGLDKAVQEFFERETEMEEFLAAVYILVDKSIARYQQRGFDYLSVSFGCTGGQHRSVYAAEKLSQHISKKFDVKIDLSHREQQNLTI